MPSDANKFSPNQQALLKIRELKQQLEEARQASNAGEPIAIVSMACRFPRSATSPELFWESLVKQVDEVGEIPEDRWDLEAFYDEDPEVPGKMYARRGVFLDQLDMMDPEFFGISPREATWVDPQQRLLLEVGWEALERAGWTPEVIGEHTGIFVGWMHNDYQNEASDSFLNLNPYIATGAAGSFLCGRLAYYLGLQGPSVAVDTACSSSLVALHLAIQSLQRGDCDRALVGAVNAICSPTTNILTCKLKALSPQGHSRAFDAAADGYLRGEGCGVITVRRLADALADGDQVLGVIRGSAVGHNGFSSGLTAPNPQAQEKVIRQALQEAGLTSLEISYLEAHGTGTELGDPIEMQAAAAALGENRTADNPLFVGSVKTNIGHLEAAAGMAGIMKVLLSMQHNRIAGQMNFENPNPHIAWDRTPVKVLTEMTEWPDLQSKIAGVSAFGMSGTNAHVIIEEPPQAADPRPTPKETTRPHLVLVSGKQEESLGCLAGEYANALTNPELALADVSHTTMLGRSHFPHRLAVVARTREDAMEQLRSAARGETAAASNAQGNRQQPKIAWQFTGQGSQYPEMARNLYEHQPLFRAALDECDTWLKSYREGSLLDVLFCGDERIHNTYWTQPAIFAVQMGLVKLLQAWGLEPNMVLGHSVGQYAAACTAGMMSWQDGLRLISERGRLIGELPAGGKMLAVFAPLDRLQPILDSYPDLSLAALNGTHIVVSGTESAIVELQEKMPDGLRSKMLTTSHAFHSQLMEPALQPFQQIVDEVAFTKARLPLVCNVSGQVLAAETELDGHYWARHIREPVQFADSIRCVAENNCDMILEIGPQGILTRMAAAVWEGPAASLVSCLQLKVDDEDSVLSAVGRLYERGCLPDFEAMQEDATGRRVLIPTYPFQRRRFWGPDKPRAYHAEYHTAHPLLGSKIALAGADRETRYEGFVDVDSPAWLPDHEVMGNVVMPGAALIEMGLAAAGEQLLSEVTFHQPLQLASRTALQTVVKKGSDNQQALETYSAAANTDQWVRNFTASLLPHDGTEAASLNLETLQEACDEAVSPEEFYNYLQDLGLNYGPAFRTIDALQISSGEVLSHLCTEADVRGYMIPPPLLDGALHSLAVGLLKENNEDLFLPVGVKKVRCYRAIENEIWCYAKWTQNEGANRTADVFLFDKEGRVALHLEELRVQQVSLAALRQMSGGGNARLASQLNWKPFRLSGSRVQNTGWLVVRSESAPPEFANEMVQALTDRSNSVIQISLQHDCEFSVDPETNTRYQMDPREAENWQRWLAQLSETHPDFKLQGIAWLLDGDADAAAEKTAANCQGLLHWVQALAAAGHHKIECGFQLITVDGVATNETESVNPHVSQYWGLGRVLGAEQPEFRCRLVDIRTAELEQSDTMAAMVEVLLTETRDNQLAIRSGQLLVPRMERVSLKASSGAFSANPAGSYLVTGGLGMLGRHVARWLVDRGAKQVVLVSRRSADTATQEFLDSLSQSGCDVVVHSADVSQRADVESMMQKFDEDWQPLAGVIHAAGVLDDGLLESQTWERFEKVLAPKISAAQWLHEFTTHLDLDLFVLYSSAASVLGSPGQSNYATGNAFLDGLAWHRRQQGLPALSINWGPWALGMADDEKLIKRMALQGITPLTVEDAHSVMEKLLLSNVVQATVMDVEWRRLRMGPAGETPAMLENLVGARRRGKAPDSALVNKLKQLPENARRPLLVKTFQETLQNVLSMSEPLDTSRPLIEMGLDSLMAVEFGTELQQMLGDQFPVGPAMLFDHPTVDAIADHVLELITQDGSTAATEKDSSLEDSASARGSMEREDIAIVGMSCRFPGAQNIDEFWDNLLHGVDSVTEIPSERWDIDRFYSKEREPGKMYTREGGFLDDIADFDAAFFNISEQEACWIDPQHRMLLENSYRAMEHAGIPLAPLPDNNVGVFMGIMGQDYAFLPSLDDQDVIDGFQGAGLSHSAGVGRISFLFGFEGPSISVDTASSSSLVAVLQAAKSLQDGNCNLALAGGVNAILAPVNSLLMSKAGLLSPDGRCRSFSADANGFGRGEGCGVVVMKRISDAQRDGDRVLAVIRGGAIVHNGFSGGITAPSGKAQGRVIEQALRDARVAPSQVQYLEAHGTGTEFGDPMELGAAASVYGKGRKPDQPLLIGSAKANISHLEAAGGISGLIKTVLALQHNVIPPQIHCQDPSPHIPWQRLPVKIVQEKTAWPEAEQKLAAVTALGLVGTNAHVILGSAAIPESTDAPSAEAHPEEARNSHLLVLSARSEAALNQMVADYLALLKAHPDMDLASLCYTAGVGRRHYEWRLAITFETSVSAIEQLTQFQSAKTPQRNGQSAHNGSSEMAQDVMPAAGPSGFAKGVPRVGWLLTADSAGAFEAACQLYQDEPFVRRLFDSMDERLGQHLRDTSQPEISLRDRFTAAEAAVLPSDFYLFLLQVATVELWKSWGLQPDAVLGVGLGQLTASCVAGGLCPQDALILAYETSRLKTQEDADLDAFEALADQFNYYPPNLPLVCSLSGQAVPIHRSLGGSYWREQIHAESQIEQALDTFSQMECELIVQIGPPMPADSVVSERLKSFTATILHGLRTDESTGNSIIHTVQRLYVAGMNPDFRELYRYDEPTRVALPGYPFQKKRYWITEISRFLDKTGSKKMPAGATSQ